MEELKNLLFNKIPDYLPTLVDYVWTVVVALIVLWIGFAIIKKVTKALKRVFEKRNVDSTLAPFFVSLTNIGLKALLVITVINYVGIPITSFVALLGAAGIAIGAAFSGTLSNFAGGVLLLALKPFKVGDYVDLQGYSGTIKEIQIFNTVITTVDNKVVYLPNGGVSTSSLVNYSTMSERRVDFTFGIGYGDDIDKAYAAIKTVIDAQSKILKDPAPFMAVSNLGESSVDIVVRVWVKAADYWDVFFYMNEFVKKEFDKQNISIPFPQRDVHIINN